MSDIIEEKGKVLSFTLLKIEKGREKIERIIRYRRDSMRNL